MSKLATVFFTLLLLLSFGLIHASRPTFASNGASSLHAQGEWDAAGNEASRAESLDDEDCEEGREECLMRRTLAAHVDYIYTQKHKPRN